MAFPSQPSACLANRWPNIPKRVFDQKFFPTCTADRRWNFDSSIDSQSILPTCKAAAFAFGAVCKARWKVSRRITARASKSSTDWKLWIACLAALPGSLQYGFGLSVLACRGCWTRIFCIFCTYSLHLTYLHVLLNSMLVFQRCSFVLCLILNDQVQSTCHKRAFAGHCTCRRILSHGQRWWLFYLQQDCLVHGWRLWQSPVWESLAFNSREIESSHHCVFTTHSSSNKCKRESPSTRATSVQESP